MARDSTQSESQSPGCFSPLCCRIFLHGPTRNPHGMIDTRGLGPLKSHGQHCPATHKQPTAATTWFNHMWHWRTPASLSDFCTTWFPLLADFRLLLFLWMSCLLSRSATCSPVAFPLGCIFTNSSVRHGIRMSVNCSDAGLVHYILGFSSSEHNDTLWTNSNVLDSDVDNILDIINLDLSNNGLTSVRPVLADGDSSNISITIQARSLSFRGNNINQIQAGDLGVFADVTTLDLSQNQIQHLDVQALGELAASLVSLNLSYNHLSDIHAEFLGSLVKLQVLDLSFNKLTILPIPNQAQPSTLRQLHLRNNQLQSIVDSNFSQTTAHSVEVLDVSNNYLAELPSETLALFPSLRYLNAANNSIQNIGNFHSLQHLEELILDWNDICNLTTPFLEIPSLRRLSLAYMACLSNLSHDAFSGLSGLVYLNLSHNPLLTFLPLTSFRPLIQLHVLDVSDSGLLYLSRLAFHNNVHLRQIHLLDNPFVCSCTNAWLAQEAEGNKSRLILNGFSLHCFNGTTSQSISTANADCSEILLHNVSKSITARLGSKILFQCPNQAESSTDTVEWTTSLGQHFYQHPFHPGASDHLLTPKDIEPDSAFHRDHYWHQDSSSYHSELIDSQQRIFILSDGSLYIDYLLRTDAGFYQCRVSNVLYNQTLTIKLYIHCDLGREIKLYSCLVGLLCAISFFTLNLIYVIISWTSRRLVNKRRREIIRQMLENMNGYKSAQMGKIYENYTHQLSRVRNQYHVQCDRLHKNYTSQVNRMKRGCSNQVEKVRENYHSRLAQLRDYSSCQILQIRERATTQIVRIRDYGANQLDRLRETYKLQHQHVIKLMDTMNLDNCRSIVETECLRTESMMYDIDLLAGGDDDRTDSPGSSAESHYSTAASSPASSLEDSDLDGLRQNLAQEARQLGGSDSSENSGQILQLQTTIDLELPLPRTPPWDLPEAGCYDHTRSTPRYFQDSPDSGDFFPTQSEDELARDRRHSGINKSRIYPGSSRTALQHYLNHPRTAICHRSVLLAEEQQRSESDSDAIGDAEFQTPQESPAKIWRGVRHQPITQQSVTKEAAGDTDSTEDADSRSHETIL